MSDFETKTILITGSTDGVGKELAKMMLLRGHHVVLHGRNPVKGERTLRELKAHTDSGRFEYYNADFASLAEVAALGDTLRHKLRRLDVLVNNAGIGIEDGQRQQSQDGLELRFQVNYLAHYALTHALLPLLQESAPARVIQISSAGQAPLDFSNVMLKARYGGYQAYCQSKLAQIMLTRDLGEAFDPGVLRALAIHPATFMDTKMVTSPMSTVEEGAKAIAHLVLGDPDLLEQGAYFNQTHPSRAHSQAYDPEARRELRELSERLIAPFF